VNLIAFAFGAGVLATVNPCGFVMLPAFFGLSIGTGTRPGSAAASRVSARLAQGFTSGLAVSSGFTAVFAGTGILVALGLRQLAQAVPIAAVIVGAALTVAGLAMAAGRSITLGRLPFTTRRPRTATGDARGARSMVMFGAGYAVASVSCTFGVLLAVVAQATATGRPLQAIVVFAAYAVGAATVLVSVAVATALAHATLAITISKAMPVVSRIGGILLTLSGLYLVFYWWPALHGRPPSATAAGITEQISGNLSQALDNHSRLTVAIAVIVLTGGAVLFAARRPSATYAARPDSVTPTNDGCGCEPTSISAGSDEAELRPRN